MNEEKKTPDLLPHIKPANVVTGLKLGSIVSWAEIVESGKGKNAKRFLVDLGEEPIKRQNPLD